MKNVYLFLVFDAFVPRLAVCQSVVLKKNFSSEFWKELLTLLHSYKQIMILRKN